jgi:GPH family glycoside/pentoside/hexuronide:cation symporter
MSRSEPSWRTLAVYGVPALGVAAPAFFVQFYFLSFATDTLLLAPATVGALLAAGRIWDAITDPLAGYGSDRTRTRWGRRRPWMLLAAPASALAFVALWNPPASVDSSLALTVWSAAALFLFTAAYTAWAIPHQALGVELSDDSHVRSRIFGVRFVVSVCGAGLSFGGMQFVGTASDPRTAAGTLALGVSLAVFVLLLVPVFGLRERPEFQARNVVNPYRAMRDVAMNPIARRLLAIWFVAQIGMSSQGVIAPYMATYVLKRPDLMGVMPALFIAPMILSVPVWIGLARRFGRRRVWRASMLGASVSYALLFVLPSDDFAVMGSLLGLAGFWSGCMGPVGPTFFASVVDEDAERSGERREGTYFAAKEFVEKASGAFVALAVGSVLQLVGFEPNAVQSESVELAIRGCLGLLPGVTLLIGALLLSRLAIGDDSTATATRPR